MPVGKVAVLRQQRNSRGSRGFVTHYRFISQDIFKMTLGTILIIILVLVLIGALPSWPHSRSWGYGPSGILGVVVVVILILLLMGRI